MQLGVALNIWKSSTIWLRSSLWSSGSHAVATDDPASDTPLSEIAMGQIVVMLEDRGLELIVEDRLDTLMGGGELELELIVEDRLDTLMGGGELELEVTVTLGV